MNKEKWIVYGLISVFSLLMATFASVVVYSDFFYPEKFNQQFCSASLIGEKKTALELARWWMSSRVHKDEFYVRSPDKEERKSIDSQMASMMFEKSSYGAALWVGVRLGLVTNRNCEVLIQNNEIQDIQRK